MKQTAKKRSRKNVLRIANIHIMETSKQTEE